MAGNPLASLPGLPQRPSLARSSASETRLTQPGIEGARSRKLNSAPTAAFRLKSHDVPSGDAPYAVVAATISRGFDLQAKRVGGDDAGLRRGLPPTRQHGQN